MATAAGPEFARVSWHRIGAAGTLVGLGLMMVAGGLTGRLLAGPADGVFFAGGVAAVLLIHHLVRGSRSPGWWFIWPVVGLALVNLFHVVDPQAAQQIAGLIYVVFLFAGLTQPRGRALLMLPLALYGLAELLDQSASATAARVCVAAFGWAVTAELPALMLRRLVQQQRVLQVSAETDALTGLRNRHGLEQLLATTSGEAFLVLLDLDHFKRYNDTYGHLAGDQVLAEFAGMLKRQSRSKDVVIRYGGEEFLIVLTGVDQQTAEGIVARWADAWSSNPFGITFSAGITNSGGVEALARADELLYAAKSAGRNRIQVGLAGR